MRCNSAGFLAVLLIAGSAVAHQPVMDMAPRWEGGYGFQVRHEYRSADDLLDGDDEIDNPFGREKRVQTTWLEAIYTFRRELRATIKIPWVNQDRVSVINGRGIRQSGSGLGDIIVGVPLRKYWNFGKATANVGLTPSLRLPTGSTGDDYPVGDGSWDAGLSVSFSAESYRWYMLADTFWWKNTSGNKGINAGDVLGLDLNLGVHPFHNNDNNTGGFLMLDFEARYQGHGVDSNGSVTGGSRYTLGPVLVGYWGNWMARGGIKFPVYERVFSQQVDRGIQYDFGIGVTF